MLRKILISIIVLLRLSFGFSQNVNSGETRVVSTNETHSSANIGGTLIVSSGATLTVNGSFGLWGTGSVIVQSGGTLVITNGLSITNSNAVYIYGVLNVTGGGLSMSVGGTLLLDGGNTNTVVGAVNVTNNVNLTITTGTTLNITGNVNNSVDGQLNIDGTIAITGNYYATNTADVGGTGNFTTTGSMQSINSATVFGVNPYTCSSNCNGRDACSSFASTISASQTLCSNQAVALSGNAIASATYQWEQSTTSTSTGFANATGTSTNQNYNTPILTSPTTYYFRRKNTLSGCVEYSNVLTIKIGTPVAASAISGPSTVCASATGVYSIMAIPGATSYTWTYSGTGATINATNTVASISFSPTATSGTLSVRGVNSCGNGTAATYNITVNNPSVTVTSPASRCGDGSITIGATPSTGGTVNWYAASSGGSSLGSGNTYTNSYITATTTYYAEVVNSGCISPNRTAVVATRNAPPTGTPVIAGSTGVCFNASVAYSVSGVSNASTYSWAYSGNAASITGNNTNNITLNSLTTSGNISVFGVSAQGCVGTTTQQWINVNVGTSPIVNNISNQTVCNNLNSTSVTFTGVGATSYNWMNNLTSIGLGANGTGNIGSFTAINSGVSDAVATIMVTPIGSCGAGSSKSFTYTVKSSPTVVINNPATVCSGTAVNLTETAITDGSTAGLTFTYWTNEAATSSLSSPSAVVTAGTYYIKGTDVSNCFKISTVVVNMNNSPTISAQPSTTIATYCQNTTSTALSVTAAAGSGTISTYTWYSNTTASNTGGLLVATNTSSATTNTYSPLTTTAGTLYYYCVVTNSNGCTVTSNVSGSIVVRGIPTAVAGGSQTICQSGTATVSGASSTNGTISWTENGAGTITGGSTSLTPTYTPAAGDAGNTVLMTLTVSNSPCTAATASYSVAVSPLVSNNAIGSDETVCVNSSTTVISPTVTLSGGNGSYAYTWEMSTTSASAGFATASGQTASSFTFIPLTTTTWFRRVVGSGGCSSTSNVVQKSINGTSFTWTGNVNSTWNVSGNWCNNTVPTTNDDPTIPVVSTNYPVIDNITAYGNDITVATGSRITIQNNGTLDISGNWANNGLLYPNDGTKVRFSAATGTQTITGSATQYFYNLEKSSGSTLVIGTGVNVQINRGGLVSVNAGTFDLNNRTLLLKSKISATGIDSTASLGVVVGSIANTSNFTQERYNSAVRGVRYISSPVSGMTFARLKDSIVIAGPTAAGFDAPNTTASTAKEYQEPRNYNWTKCWVSLTNINTVLASGTGYYLYVPSKRTTVFPAAEPVTLLMKGTPFTGSKTFSLSYTATGSTGWNLVGNPYPSAIDWDSPSWTKTNLDGAIYIWDPAMGTSGGYYTYSSSMASDGRSNGSVIASSQGFFVKATGANPALSVTENVKVNVKAKTNFRKVEPSYVTLKVTNQNGDVDFTTVRLSAGLVNEDALKLTNPKLNFYSKKSSQNMSINSVNELFANLEVPLYLESASSTNYKIEVIRVGGDINANSDLKLKDESTGEVVPLSEGTVLNLSKDANTQRLTLFRVAESQVVTTATDNKLSEMQLYPNNLVEGDYPTLITSTTTEKRITIYNASGGVVSSQGTSAREYALSDFKHLASGVYQVRVASMEGTRVFKVVK